MKHENQSAFRREQREPVVGGNLFTRSLAARTIASLRRGKAADVAAELWPSDRLLHQHITRAASNPAMTGVAGWAAELAQKRVADVIEALGPVSGAADVLKQCLVLDWDGAGIISAPGFVANAANSGFVAEGAPIAVRQLNVGPAQLLPYALATIAALTREMVEGSNAEALIRDALVRSTGLAFDAVFFGNAAATAAQPAGIRNGIAALGASNNADLYEAFADDFAALIDAVSAVGGKGPYVLVGCPGRVATMLLHYQSQPNPNFAFVASSAMGGDVMAIAPQAIVAALSADQDVETANAATLVMDTAPGAAGTMGPEAEMWQTDSIAVKVRWPVSWALRNAGAVAWLTPSWK
ncbi:hypothetical protein Q3C01_05355 [Bradyrhizobium sp. UFLA05-109]